MPTSALVRLALALIAVGALVLSLTLPPGEVLADEYRDPGGVSFSDVPAGHVFEEEVAWLASTGITQGRGDGTFGLNDPVTRGAMAAFLYRYDGGPDGPFDAPDFDDVPDGHVFADEIAWLAAIGVTQGRGDGSFGLNDSVTRGAMAAFLYRYDGQPNGPFDAPDFADVPDGHVFDEEIAWLASTGITRGRDDGSYGLNVAVTRGQMAAFLFRFQQRASSGPESLRVSTERLPVAARGLSYGAALEADGGQAPYVWQAQGLPDGVGVDPDGRILGLVSEAGSWSLNVSVEDAEGVRATAQLAFDVEDVGVPEPCVGQDCSLLEAFDGTDVEVNGKAVSWTTYELDVEQVEAVQTEGYRIDAEGQVAGSAQLTVAGLGVVPEVEDVLAVPEAAHPQGHVGPLIVQAEQVEITGEDQVEVSGALVGLMSAYHSGVVHILAADTTVVDAAGLPVGDEPDPGFRTASARCEQNGEQSVSVEFTPSADGAVYVAWRWGVPQQIEVSAEVAMALNAEVALAGQVSCALADIPTLTVVKGPAIIRLATELTFGADAALEGSVTTSVACSTMFGYGRDEPSSFGCGGQGTTFELDTVGQFDTSAQAWIGAALEPSISMAEVVGVSGSMGATFRAHLTPLATPQARLDVEIPTTLKGCLGCDLPLVGTLVDRTFVEETYGPRTLWLRNLYSTQPDADASEWLLRSDGLGQFDFGRSASEVLDAAIDAFGAVTADTGRIQLFVPDYDWAPDWYDTTYCDAVDYCSIVWNRPAYREVCIDMLCLIAAPDDDEFVGWNMRAWNVLDDAWSRSSIEAVPDLATVEGIGIGSTYDELMAAFPNTELVGGEGGSIAYDIGWPLPPYDGARPGTGGLSGRTIWVDGTFEFDLDGSFVLSIAAGDGPSATCC